MKILFVQKMAAISGSELYLMHILPELKRRGYDVSVLIIFPTVPVGTKPFISHFASYGISSHEIYGHGALSPLLMLKLRQLLLRGSYDLVQSNLVHADLWMVLQKLFFFPRLKLISVKHGFDEAYAARYGNNPKYLKSSLFFWVQKFSGYFVNFNVSISKGLFDMYVDGKMVKKEKIRNIYYGLNLNDLTNLTVEKDPPEVYALILGRLVKYKGHDMLLKAWRKVSAVNPSWKLYIVGGGSYEENLKKQLLDLSLSECVHFLGFQPNPHQLIRDARFLCVTSTWEGFGLIMLEGWAQKKPIVGFDVPAINELVIDSKHGRLATPFDIDGLADMIIDLFTNPEKTKRLGEAGYRRLHDFFSVERMTDEMEIVYRQVNAISKHG